MSDSISPESMSTTETKKSTTPPVVVEDRVSSKTVMYLLWHLYKANLISRSNLTMIFKSIRQGEPVDVLKALVEEEGKKG